MEKGEAALPRRSAVYSPSESPAAASKRSGFPAMILIGRDDGEPVHVKRGLADARFG